MNNFILSYNPFTSSPSEGQLLNHLQVSRYIVQYYQPFFGTYIVKSEQSAAAVSDSLKGLFENTPFMVSQLFSGVSGGTLPYDIWQWINHGYVPPQASAATYNPDNALLGNAARG